jgi:hypothetical protein
MITATDAIERQDLDDGMWLETMASTRSRAYQLAKSRIAFTRARAYESLRLETRANSMSGSPRNRRSRGECVN